MNGKRLLALLAAAAMIAGAWFVRTRVIDRKTTDAATPGSTPAASNEPSNASVTIICIPELQEVCRLSGAVYSVQAAGQTLAQIGSQPNPDVVWVTTAPLPEMADLLRGRAGLPPLQTGERKVLASTSIVVTAPTERAAILKSVCPDLAWTCIGDKTSRPWKELGGQTGWQDVTFRHLDPLTSATGLSVLGAALAGRVGRTDLSTSDVNSGEVSNWVNQLENANKQLSSDPLTSVLVGTRFDIVGALATQVPSGGRVSTFEPTPVARVGATVIATAGKLSASLVANLTSALGKNGWSPAVAPVGLPDATGMEAVQKHWQEMIR